MKHISVLCRLSVKIIEWTKDLIGSEVAKDLRLNELKGASREDDLNLMTVFS